MPRISFELRTHLRMRMLKRGFWICRKECIQSIFGGSMCSVNREENLRRWKRDKRQSKLPQNVCTPNNINISDFCQRRWAKGAHMGSFYEKLPKNWEFLRSYSEMKGFQILKILENLSQCFNCFNLKNYFNLHICLSMLLFEQGVCYTSVFH